MNGAIRGFDPFDFPGIPRKQPKTPWTWAHLQHVHGYGNVDRVGSVSVDGARLWVLATPVDGTEIELTLVSQIRDTRKPKRMIVGLGFLPMRLRSRLANHIMLSAQQRDVLQDVVIWERKQYRPRPRLSRSDGEIGLFRRYCEQFYPDRYGDAGPDRLERRKIMRSTPGGPW